MIDLKKMRRRWFFILPAFSFLAACANRPRIHPQRDPFFSGTIYAADPIVLKNVRYDGVHSGYLALVVERYQEENASARYDFKVRCGPSRRRQMNVPPGPSLQFWMNQSRQLRYFSQGGSAGTQAAAGAHNPEPPHVVYEDVSPDDLKDLSQAKTLQIQVNGSPHSVTADFNPADFSVLRVFVSRFIHSVS